MGRTIGRIALGLIGAASVLVGAGATAAGIWIVLVADGRDSMRTTAQVIEVPGCTTVVMEIAEARVDFEPFDELTYVDPLADRIDLLLNLGVDGITVDPWLIGVGEQSDVEQRLLGARYCLIEVSDGSWSMRSIAIDADAPDVDLSGVRGRWATVDSGESVSVPLPRAGSSVVVSGSGDSSMSTISFGAEYHVRGASQAGLVALIAGITTMALGVGLLVLSIIALRPRGLHEDSVA